ncbi:MAG TPA: NTP transferase domain-containing protein [Nocardioidaceae bacterium]|nr:NTP transferase domain-containing protein [Nocardioidaceae bacterium]
MADAVAGPVDYDAIVVAGGRSSRLGAGVDKTRLSVDGQSLLDRVLTAVVDARQRVVVGEPRPVVVDAVWAREEPVGGGPAAGVVAGLESVTAPIVMLLAGDLPHVGAATVHRLLDAIGSGDGAILVDADGRRQHLTCSIVADALRRSAATRATWHDAPMYELLAPLRLRAVPVHGHEADDIDTPADLSGTYGPGAPHVPDNSREEKGS